MKKTTPCGFNLKTWITIISMHNRWWSIVLKLSSLFDTPFISTLSSLFDTHFLLDIIFIIWNTLFYQTLSALLDTPFFIRHYLHYLIHTFLSDIIFIICYTLFYQTLYSLFDTPFLSDIIFIIWYKGCIK